MTSKQFLLLKLFVICSLTEIEEKKRPFNNQRGFLIEIGIVNTKKIACLERISLKNEKEKSFFVPEFFFVRTDAVAKITGDTSRKKMQLHSSVCFDDFNHTI